MNELPTHTTLRQAFEQAAKLSPGAQEVLAACLLAELESEDEFNRAINASSDRLALFAAEARAEFQAGETDNLVVSRSG